MSGSLAANMLRLYRQNSPLEMADQAKDFRRLSDKDRDELLWWMIMHANVALQQQGGAPTEAFNDIERRIRGDA